MTLYKEQEHLCRELGNKRALQTSLGNQALILQDRGDLKGAMVLLKEKEHLCRELGNFNGLSTALANQAKLLSSDQGRRSEARRLADEALEIAIRHGYQPLVSRIKHIRYSIIAEGD